MGMFSPFTKSLMARSLLGGEGGEHGEQRGEQQLVSSPVVALHEGGLVEHGGEAGLKAAGKLRVEGKSYEVKDGDVMHFRFNV